MVYADQKLALIMCTTRMNAKDTKENTQQRQNAKLTFSSEMQQRPKKKKWIESFQSKQGERQQRDTCKRNNYKWHRMMKNKETPKPKQSTKNISSPEKQNPLEHKRSQLKMNWNALRGNRLMSPGTVNEFWKQRLAPKTRHKQNKIYFGRGDDKFTRTAMGDDHHDEDGEEDEDLARVDVDLDCWNACSLSAMRRRWNELTSRRHSEQRFAETSLQWLMMMQMQMMALIVTISIWQPTSFPQLCLEALHHQLASFGSLLQHRQSTSPPSAVASHIHSPASRATSYRESRSWWIDHQRSKPRIKIRPACQASRICRINRTSKRDFFNDVHGEETDAKHCLRSKERKITE